MVGVLGLRWGGKVDVVAEADAGRLASKGSKSRVSAQRFVPVHAAVDSQVRQECRDLGCSFRAF